MRILLNKSASIYLMFFGIFLVLAPPFCAAQVPERIRSIFPAFLIIHGEKDESVPYTHSLLLQSYLDQAKVKNEVIIIEGAPHFSEMFDSELIRT